MLRYTILTAENAQDLIMAVNKAVEDGFEPVGGIAIESHAGVMSPTYYQAIYNNKTSVDVKDL